MIALFITMALLSGPVITDQIYPGVDRCDAAWHESNGSWPNPTGRTIYLKQLRVWHGASAGLTADLLGAIYLVKENGSRIVLFVGAFDKYDPLEGSHESTLNVQPDYIELGRDEGLQFSRRCGPQNYHPGGMESLQVAAFFYTLGDR